MSTQKEVKLPHLCSPITYDDYLDKILLAIYRVGKAATSKEIAGKDSSLEDYVCVGRAASFLSHLGLFVGERSPFELSPSGREMAIALTEGKKDVAQNLWQQTLKGHSLHSELQTYMKAQGGNRGTSLGFAEHLRKLAGKSWNTTYMKEGGKRMCILFASKGLLTFDRDKDSISFPPDKPQLPKGQQPPPTIGTQVVSQATAGEIGMLPFSVNITVEAKDADSIREVINLIKELSGRK